jgi:hypothetical protein
MEKELFDAGKDGTHGGCAQGSVNCPKFTLNEQSGRVTLTDRDGNQAFMTIHEYNNIIKAARTGVIAELKTLQRK